MSLLTFEKKPHTFRSRIQGMEKTKAWKFHVLIPFALAMSLVLLPLVPFATAASSQSGASWDWNLLGPLNSAQDDNGNIVTLTGSGVFTCADTSCTSGSVTGGGSYTVVSLGGTVLGSGTWSADTFDSFLSWGLGDSPGEGGHLELEGSFSGLLAGSQHIVIQCSMWSQALAPPGYPWPSDYVTVGSFTIPHTGAVMFNLHQA